MVGSDILYYLVTLFNKIIRLYNIICNYFKQLTVRVNKTLIGNDNIWIISNNGLVVRQDDIALVNRPFISAYSYDVYNKMFLNINYKNISGQEFKSFDYIGGELRFISGDIKITYDITEWLSSQKYKGIAEPTILQILLAWAISNNQIGLLIYKDNDGSEVMFLDKMADEIVYKLSSIFNKFDASETKKNT
jgi:hypothetical protein